MRARSWSHRSASLPRPIVVEVRPQPGWREVLVVAIAIVAVVLGAAVATSILPRDVQDAIFHRPVLIAVLVVGTGWLLWRISRPRPSTDDAPIDRRVDDASGPDEGVRS